MNCYGRLRSAILIVCGLLCVPVVSVARISNGRRAEVRIVILPPRETSQGSHASIKLFRNVRTHDDLASSFQKIDDAGLQGEWYLSEHIPKGEYEVHVSLGVEPSDVVRFVGIDDVSENLYFTSDMTSAHILVVDPLGNALQNVIVDKVVDEFGMDHAKEFDKALGARLPFGLYQIKVHAQGFGSATREYCFCTSKSWSVLGVSVPGGDEVYPEATVRLKGILKAKDSIKQLTIIRLVPGYLSSSMETVIEPGGDGRFEVAGSLPAVGNYILSVTRGDHVVTTGVVRLPLGHGISVPLENGEEIWLEAGK